MKTSPNINCNYLKPFPVLFRLIIRGYNLFNKHILHIHFTKLGLGSMQCQSYQGEEYEKRAFVIGVTNFNVRLFV